MVVVVQHDALTRWKPAAQQLVGREHLEAVFDRQGMQGRPTHSVFSPARSGRDSDLVEVIPKYLLRADGTPACDLNVGQAPQLRQAVIEDSDPRGETRQASFERNSAAKLSGCGLSEDEFVSALPERHRGLQSSWPRPDDEDLGVARLRADPLGVPSAPPLLAYGG